MRREDDSTCLHVDVKEDNWVVGMQLHLVQLQRRGHDETTNNKNNKNNKINNNNKEQPTTLFQQFQ